MKLITFISTFKNYDNEISGRKSNTVRNCFKWSYERKEKAKQATHIKERRGYTKEFFIRKLTDITFWQGQIIFSWSSDEK